MNRFKEDVKKIAEQFMIKLKKKKKKPKEQKEQKPDGSPRDAADKVLD